MQSKQYDFDTLTIRKNTGSIKYDLLEERFGRADLLPMWVADMDFETPQVIVDALKTRMEHGIFGYVSHEEAFFDAVRGYYARRDIALEKSDLLFCQNVVSSLVACTLAFSEAKDSIVIQPPIYPPFYDSILQHDRQVLKNTLVVEQGKYTVNFTQLGEQLQNAKMLYLCHPHNPTGKLFSREELAEIIRLCKKNDALLISDEIHSDFIFDNATFHSILSFDEAKDIAVVLSSSAKSYNVAGISGSYIISKNTHLLRKMRLTLSKYQLNVPNLFGSIATVAAYTKGQDWLEQLRSYLEENRDLACDFIQNNIPNISFIKPQATYLLWLDFNALNQPHEQIKKRLLENCHLAFNNGTDFDKEASGFFRMNLATSKANITEALNRLQKEFA